MEEKWYYVQEGERKGPLNLEELKILIQIKTLTAESYVWTKGLKEWKQLKFFPHLLKPEDVAHDFQIEKNFIFNKEEIQEQIQVHDFQNVFYLRTGLDRSQGEGSLYGPYHLQKLKELYLQRRINGHTLVFFPGLKDWVFLADLDNFREIFQESPPEISLKLRELKKNHPLLSLTLTLPTEEDLHGIGFHLSLGGVQCLLPKHPSLRKNLPVKITLKDQFQCEGILRETSPDLFLHFKKLTPQQEDLLKRFL